MTALSRIVARKVAIMFPDPAKRLQVERELEKYGQNAEEAQIDRVRLAILKLSKGDPAKVSIAGAKEDPLDIVNWAEQPEASKAAMHNDKLRPDEKEKIEARDWTQYHEWLAQGLK
jgi:hypothetical protein